MKKLIFIFVFAYISLLNTFLPAQTTWTPTNGLENKIIFSMTQCGNTMFAGEGVSFLIHGSLNKSTDYGNNWSQINLGGDPSAIMCMAVKDSFVYAGSYQNHLYLSSDRGLNWSNVQINSGFGTGIFEIGVSGNNIFCYVNTISPYYISTNNGYNWSPVVSPALSGNINGLLNIGNKFFAATRKGIAYSNDHGLTWVKPHNYGLPGNPDSTRPLSCLTNIGNRIYTSCIDKILYTDDNGENWIEAGINPGGSPNINTMVSTPVPFPKVYASMNGQNDTTRGVGTCSYNGANWVLMNQGFPVSTSVMTLWIGYSLYLYAGTNGRGIYKIQIKFPDGINNNVTADEFSLMQNYPNPFNPMTSIKYELRNAAEVTMKVYDAAGNEVETLVSGKQNAGSYSVSFNGAGLASGIYFYELEAGGFSEVRKMVLVK